MISPEAKDQKANLKISQFRKDNQLTLESVSLLDDNANEEDDKIESLSQDSGQDEFIERVKTLVNIG